MFKCTYNNKIGEKKDESESKMWIMKENEDYVQDICLRRFTIKNETLVEALVARLNIWEKEVWE